MTPITIDKKKYVLIPEQEFYALQKKAAQKTKAERLLTVQESRAYGKKLVKKWLGEKSL